MALLTLDQSQLQDFINSQSRELEHLGGWRAFRIPDVRIVPHTVTAPSRRTWAGSFTTYNNTINIYSSLFSPLQGAILHRALESTLLHELAHALQYNRFGHDVPDHGREFRETAWAINAHYKRDIVTTYHNLALTPEGEAAAALERKARALLALTQSTNQHEAELAAAKFADLAARFNLAFDATAALSELPPVETQLVATYKRMDTWRRYLAQGVAESFACSMVYNSSCGMEPAKVKFIGRPRAIDQAVDLLIYLEDAIDRVARQAMKEQPGMGRSYWASYRVGLATTLRTRLRRQIEERNSEGLPATEDGAAPIPALVLRTAFEREEAATSEALKKFFPKLGRGRAATVSSGEGYRQGGVAGRSISLARQVRSGATRQLTGAA